MYFFFFWSGLHNIVRETKIWMKLTGLHDIVQNKILILQLRLLEQDEKKGKC